MRTQDGNIAVVTGGARGIGEAIGDWLLHRGWRVALIDRDGQALAQAAARLTPTWSGRMMTLACDVSEPAQVAQAALEVQARWGRVDALVNNAGVAVFKATLDTSFAEWRQVMATNLDGAFLCTQAFGALMVKQGRGAVVNVACTSGLRASTMRVAYGTSKAALIHLTKQHAVELGNAGVRVNAVAPGPVETDMARQVHTSSIRADYRNAIPMGRYGSCREIAAVVGFLCSDDATYVNGQVLSVDGGFDAAGIGLPTLRGERSNPSLSWTSDA